MSNLLLPRRFYNQPQGAVQLRDSSFAHAIIGGVDHDYGTGKSSITNTVSQSIIEYGKRFYRGGSSNQLIYPNAGRYSRTEVTMIFVGITPSLTNGNCAWGLGLESTGSSYRFSYCTSGGAIVSYVLGTTTNAAVSPTGWTNVPVAMVVTWKSGEPIKQYMRRLDTGVSRVDMSAPLTSTANDPSSYYYRTNVSFTTNIGGTHSTLLSALSTRCMTDAEAISHLNNPWQIFKVSE